MMLVLGYVNEGVDDNVKTLNVNVVPVESNEGLDYAILEVFGGPAREFGVVELGATDPVANDPFWIIGHPQGGAQRISREKCKANDPAISGGRVLHT
jgi:hypothetical protein